MTTWAYGLQWLGLVVLLPQRPQKIPGQELRPSGLRVLGQGGKTGRAAANGKAFEEPDAPVLAESCPPLLVREGWASSVGWGPKPGRSDVSKGGRDSPHHRLNPPIPGGSPCCQPMSTNGRFRVGPSRGENGFTATHSSKASNCPMHLAEGFPGTECCVKTWKSSAEPAGDDPTEQQHCGDPARAGPERPLPEGGRPPSYGRCALLLWVAGRESLLASSFPLSAAPTPPRALDATDLEVKDQAGWTPGPLCRVHLHPTVAGSLYPAGTLPGLLASSKNPHVSLEGAKP